MYLKAVLALSIGALLLGMAASQTKPDGPVQISGRMVNTSGTPFPNRAVQFSIFKNIGEEQEIGTVTTGKDGTFAFMGVSGISYDLSGQVWETPRIFSQLATLAVVDGYQLDLGQIVVKVVPRTPGYIALVDGIFPPSQIGLIQPPTGVGPKSSSMQTKGPRSIASIVIGANGWAVHIFRDDSKMFTPSRGKRQYLSRSPLIADDRRAVGWIAITNGPKTEVALVVYRPGMPERGFLSRKTWESSISSLWMSKTHCL